MLFPPENATIFLQGAFLKNIFSLNVKVLFSKPYGYMMYQPCLSYNIVFNVPMISFQAVLREKLKYAIHFCKSIDTDDYARVAMTGAGVEENGASESDTDDWDSIGSDEPMADCVSLYST